MRLEKSKNAKRNILYGFINKIITLILPFLLRTVIIHELGSEYLGLNSLFSSILQVLNLSELGFSSAMVYSMYKPIAKQDTDTICSLLNFYRKIYKIIGISVLIVGLMIMPFLKYLISGSIPDDINIYILYLIYLINTAVSYLLFAYKTSLLEAHQRQDIVSNILSITYGGMYTFQIIVILILRNYYVYLILMPIFTIANNIIKAIWVNRLYPQYICKGKINESELKNIKKQIPGLMINKLCYISRNSFDSIFISAFLGLKISAIYGNYYYIMNAVISILMIVSNSVLAGVGNSQITDSVEENYKTMNKMNFIYMWISGWCTICMLCLYQPFMKIWVGEDLTFDFGVVILFCIYFYSMEIGVIRGIYADAAGLWWENRYRAVIESISNLVLNFVLVQFWGIYGIITATLISLLLINFAWGSQIVFKYYFKNDKQKEYFISHIKYALVTTIIAFVTLILCYILPFEGIMLFLFRLIICIIVPNVFYVLIYYHTKDYKTSVPWILKKINLHNKLSFLIPK